MQASYLSADAKDGRRYDKGANPKNPTHLRTVFGPTCTGYLPSSRLVYRQNKLPKTIIYLVPEALANPAILPGNSVEIFPVLGGEVSSIGG